MKHDLWIQQAMRCCYCESQIQPDYNDVEHFRPKARADRLNGKVDAGYWWLAWTWQNLLFSCAICNRSAKNDLFPLEHGSVPLLAEAQPPGGERSTLIDPCDEDPVESIHFVFNGLHWQPVGRNGNVRGQRTIEILKLDRPDLLTIYDAHVDHQVKPRVDAVRDAIRRADVPLIKTAWHRVRGLLSPRMQFVALTFDAIEHLLPADQRLPWDLEMPRPPIRGA
uniref:hypothetical protein n=1 Tax=Corallococcus coralloides TaxID=184914 RepID=UPI000FFF0AB5|nr:hypothetical protein [Corallococcus coralloides]